MNYKGCKRKVRKALEDMKGVSIVEVDPKQNKVTVSRYDRAAAPPEREEGRAVAICATPWMVEGLIQGKPSEDSSGRSIRFEAMRQSLKNKLKGCPPETSKPCISKSVKDLSRLSFYKFTSCGFK